MKKMNICSLCPHETQLHRLAEVSNLGDSTDRCDVNRSERGAKGNRIGGAASSISCYAEAHRCSMVAKVVERSYFGRLM